LPTKNEFEMLHNFVGNNHYEAFMAFKKKEDYGFNTLNAGLYHKESNEFRRYWYIPRSRVDEFWSSTLVSIDSVGVKYYATLTINYFRKIAIVGVSGSNSENEFLPIRCIKDN